MRKILLSMLLIAMIAVIAACGKKEDNPSSGNAETTKTAEVTKEAEKTTPEPTKEPTVEPTKEPTAEPTATPTPEPTAVPTEEPTPEPTDEPVIDDLDMELSPVYDYSDDHATIDSIAGTWLQKTDEDYQGSLRAISVDRYGRFTANIYNSTYYGPYDEAIINAMVYGEADEIIEGNVVVMENDDEFVPYVYVFLTEDGSVWTQFDWDMEQHAPMLLAYSEPFDCFFELEDEFGEYDPNNKYCGVWQADRISITVGKEDAAFIFDIIWGQSASEWYSWEYWTSFDETENAFVSSSGRCYYCVKNDGAEETSVLLYDDGSASFVITDNDTMYWHDDKDDTHDVWDKEFVQISSMDSDTGSDESGDRSEDEISELNGYWENGDNTSFFYLEDGRWSYYIRTVGDAEAVEAASGYIVFAAGDDPHGFYAAPDEGGLQTFFSYSPASENGIADKILMDDGASEFIRTE